MMGLRLNADAGLRPLYPMGVAQCGFWFDFSLRFAAEPLADGPDLVGHLLQEVCDHLGGPTPKTKKALELYIGLVVANCFRREALQSGEVERTVVILFSRGHHSYRRHRPSIPGFSLELFLRAVDALEALGYVVVIKRKPGMDKGFFTTSSYLYPTEKMSEALEESPNGVTREEKPLVELRRAIRGRKYLMKGGSKVLNKDGNPVEWPHYYQVPTYLPNCPKVRKSRKLLRSFNAFLKEATPCLRIPAADLVDASVYLKREEVRRELGYPALDEGERILGWICDKRGKLYILGHDSDGEGPHLSPCPSELSPSPTPLYYTGNRYDAATGDWVWDLREVVTHRRIFCNNSLLQGGRFYAEWQSIPSDLREFILLAGEETMELDFSGMHLRIKYAEIGLECPGDPYVLEVDGWTIGQDDLRAALKFVGLVLINAPTPLKALAAIRWKKMKGEICMPPGFEGKRLVEAFEKGHPALAQRGMFMSGTGVHLQYRDSKIAMSIMKAALEADKPMLPLHDGFRVRKSDESFFRHLMEEAYRREVKQAPIIKPFSSGPQ